jgi:hypothetical protein
MFSGGIKAVIRIIEFGLEMLRPSIRELPG